MSYFDVVTLWDVLEHVSSPTRALKVVHRWLKPGGWLFMNLPNSDSLAARVMGSRWVLLLREHLWYFSPTTVQRMLEKCDLHLEHTAPSRVVFTARNVFVRLSQYAGTLLGALGQRLSRLDVAGRLWVSFPIGDMRVVARKPIE
jgi:SAM-dependent methyltransferase